MTAQRDLDRELQSLLREGPTELPDPSFYAVRDRIEETRQRVFVGPWRVPTLNKLAPAGLGTAALVAAVVIGSRLLGAPGPNVGGPDRTPGPSPVASVAQASPEPSVAEPEGLLAPGPLLIWDSEVLGGSPITVTIHRDVLHRWVFYPEYSAFAWYDSFDRVENSDPPDGAGMIVFSTNSDLSVYRDPCHWKSTRPDTPASTVDEIVAALAAQPSRNASEPVDVTVGGYAGQSIILHVPDDADRLDCDDDEFASFETAGDDSIRRYHQGPGQIDELWILDVDGAIVILDAMYGPDTDTDLIDDLRTIAESATFE